MSAHRSTATTATTPAATFPAIPALGAIAPFETPLPDRLAVLSGLSSATSTDQALLSCGLSWTVSVV